MTTWNARARATVLVLAASLFGCNAPPSEVADQPSLPDYSPPAPELPLAFAPTYEDAVAKRYQTEYSAPAVREIFAAIRIPQGPGVHVARVLVSLPDGTPFKEYWRAFSASSEPGQTVTHPQRRRCPRLYR